MRILIAEDDEAGGLLLSSVLRKELNWEVTLTSNGGVAWWHLTDPKTDPYDLLITDLHMPEISGLDLVRRVRATKQVSSLNILVCTANKDRETVKEMIQLRTNGYILKPYQPNAVVEKVREFSSGKIHRRVAIEGNVEAEPTAAV